MRIGGVKLLRISDEIVGDLLLRSECIRVDVRELEIGKPVVPRRAVGNQRIPTPGAPALSDPGAFQHEMAHAELAQMFAHGDAGLTGAITSVSIGVASTVMAVSLWKDHLRENLLAP